MKKGLETSHNEDFYDLYSSVNNIRKINVGNTYWTFTGSVKCIHFFKRNLKLWESLGDLLIDGRIIFKLVFQSRVWRLNRFHLAQCSIWWNAMWTWQYVNMFNIGVTTFSWSILLCTYTSTTCYFYWMSTQEILKDFVCVCVGGGGGH
jgi:hypothetical protein